MGRAHGEGLGLCAPSALPASGCCPPFAVAHPSLPPIPRCCTASICLTHTVLTQRLPTRPHPPFSATLQFEDAKGAALPALPIRHNRVSAHPARAGLPTVRPLWPCAASGGQGGAPSSQCVPITLCPSDLPPPVLCMQFEEAKEARRAAAAARYTLADATGRQAAVGAPLDVCASTVFKIDKARAAGGRSAWVAGCAWRDRAGSDACVTHVGARNGCVRCSAPPPNLHLFAFPPRQVVTMPVESLSQQRLISQAMPPPPSPAQSIACQSDPLSLLPPLLQVMMPAARFMDIPLLTQPEAVCLLTGFHCRAPAFSLPSPTLSDAPVPAPAPQA